MALMISLAALALRAIGIVDALDAVSAEEVTDGGSEQDATVAVVLA